ncbi:hypothetical protein FNV43_RR05285 [Rhamnella rubrinervis]|uniref:Wound-induced protein 1 n=1 Tax=Rhamnella rubrinervis TaxID=2594499 RepID=A0A8K0MQI6_9ROSA|nr:hypothetical protein FNV43_RR05285 [Rhamnella rubrinervis]
MHALLHSTRPQNQRDLSLVELANSQAISLEEQESNNIRVVKTLYEALSSNSKQHCSRNDHDHDQVQVHHLLATYLDWWFHGPPSHQHLKRLLTGSPPGDLSFAFVPLSVVSFGSTVLVEGYDKERSVSWVHAWTVNEGIITQVREYYNTSVTVTRFGNSNGACAGASQSPVCSSEIRSQSAGKYCQSVWQSKLSSDKSMPGLVLAL